jgi:serine phosphatase RsbU (regulator of sigma subunit)
VSVILKQSIDTVKVETAVSVHNEEDVISMETDGVCEPEVSHILR